MSVFLACLVKEWRGHRRSFVMLGILIALLAVVLFIASDPWSVALGGLALHLVMVSEIAVLVVVAPGLLTNEQGNRLARRLPCGLAPVFAAKTGFLFLSLASGVGFGLLCDAALRGFLPARLRGLEVDGSLWWSVTLTGVTALGFGLWVMMVSAWLNATLLALPGAAIALAVVAAPVAWVHRTYPAPARRRGRWRSPPSSSSSLPSSPRRLPTCAVTVARTRDARRR
jgi:hypothetical protein